MKGTIGFIGGGHMATAIISGLISKNVCKKEHIVACAPSEKTRNRLRGEFGIETFSSASEMVPKCDVIVLAVLPQQVPGVFGELKPAAVANKLLLSIVAGLNISTLKSYVPDAHIVRVMPNHCCAVLEGASGYAMGAGCVTDDKKKTEEILSATGLAVEVDETQMNAVGGVSGSSPAFLYIVCRGLAAGGAKHGLSEKESVKLAAQSMIGAGKMILESGMDIESLIDSVCSPGGTTIEGVKSLQRNGLEDALIEAIDATVARSEWLEKH